MSIRMSEVENNEILFMIHREITKEYFLDIMTSKKAMLG
jgi:hypothetical protein